MKADGDEESSFKKKCWGMAGIVAMLPFVFSWIFLATIIVIFTYKTMVSGNIHDWGLLLKSSAVVALATALFLLASSRKDLAKEAEKLGAEELWKHFWRGLPPLAYYWAIKKLPEAVEFIRHRVNEKGKIFGRIIK